MALHKPTSGSYRLATTSLSLAAGPRTLCAWIKWDSLDATSALFDDRLTGVGGGGILWGTLDNPADATKFALTFIDTGGGIRRNSTAHNTDIGVWTFWSVKLPGTVSPTLGFRKNGTNTDVAGPAVTPGLNPSSVALFATVAGGMPAEVTMSDFRLYNRILTEVELDCVYHCQGSDSVIDGLVMRLPFLNGAPGTTTATTLPYDIASPGRVFTTPGIGTALTWADSPYPKRRRS